jgi:hypothetical protein
MQKTETKTAFNGMFFVLLMMGWALPFSLQQVSTKSATLPATITIPEASLDLSDLDVRDENNQQIHSAAAQQEMKNLFVSGLTQLLAFNLTPMNLFMRDFMSKNWGTFATWLKSAVQKVFGEIDAWYQGKRSRALEPAVSNFQSTAPPSLLQRFTSKGTHLSLVSSIISSTQIIR